MVGIGGRGRSSSGRGQGQFLRWRENPHASQKRRCCPTLDSYCRWDEAAIASDAALDDDSCDAVLARWIGYLWATERQDITLATKYLEEALTAPAASSAHLRDHLFTEAAMFQAWFRDDSAKARFWAAHIKRRLSPLQKSRLGTGLLWSEGKLFDAWEKLGDYFDLLRGMPASPARDLLEQNALEWKKQMESRMLTRAWRTMYSMSQEVEQAEAAISK